MFQAFSFPELLPGIELVMGATKHKPASKTSDSVFNDLIWWWTSRQLNDRGMSITREKFSNGQETSGQTFRALEASEAEAFDNSWQEQALSFQLDRVPFLKGASVRQQIGNGQRRGEKSVHHHT